MEQFPGTETAHKHQCSDRDNQMNEIDNQRAWLVRNWMRARGSFTVSDGVLAVKLGVSIRSMGGVQTVEQRRGTVVAIEMPWFWGPTRIYFRAIDHNGVVFFSPTPSSSERVVDTLEQQGFDVERHRTWRSTILIGGLFAQVGIWPYAQRMGWLNGR